VNYAAAKMLFPDMAEAQGYAPFVIGVLSEFAGSYVYSNLVAKLLGAN
jgi:hypothetical protein